MRTRLIIALLTTALLPCTPACATLIFDEAFNTDVADNVGFQTQYPAFTINGTDPVSVVGGVMILADNGLNDTTTVTIPGTPGEVIYSADIGALSSSGSYNVGLQIGANTVVFHPGFTTIPGAFRVSGPGGFGNTNMGFVPANGSLHHLEVHQYPSGLFEVEVTDANNPANVFSTSWTNLSSVGGLVGPLRSGPLGTAPGHALFDNFTVDMVIPEPSTLALFILGVAGFCVRRRTLYRTGC